MYWSERVDMSTAAPPSEPQLIEPKPVSVGAGLAPPAEFGASKPPVIETQEVAACPVCAGVGQRPFAAGYDYELQTCANLWTFVECNACAHVWLNPRPAVSTLGVIYPKTYYAYNYAAKISSLALKAKQTLDRMKFRSILGALPRAPKSYIDVGCGDGRFLRLMNEMGVPKGRTFGLELDEKVVAPLAADGFMAYCERVEDCTRVPEGSLDLATMFHVIEHVDDPARVVSRIATWLAPGGVLAMETPNVDSYDARVFHDTYWGGYHIPRHWNLFTPGSLSKLVKGQGLEVVAIKYQTGHSFWLYSLHHKFRYRRGHERPGLAKFFDPVGGSKALPALATFTAFDKLRAASGAKTSAMLLLARKPG